MDKHTITQYLADDWRVSGVKEGDTLLLHSDLTRLVFKWFKKTKIKITPGIVIDSFLLALGRKGTFLVPAFNFTSFTEDSYFDIRNTPSRMGVLTEEARKRPEFDRTAHPIHSYLVAGFQKKKYLEANNESSFGFDSPTGIMHRENAKYAALAVEDGRSVSFYHYVEEIFSEFIYYRYHKSFSGTYIDVDGGGSVRKYSMFVRKSACMTSDNDAFGEFLWAQKIYKGSRPTQGTLLRVACMTDVFNALADLIKKGKASQYLIKKAKHELKE
jgi:aminoglycoside 3-N-acetyltransferase